MSTSWVVPVATVVGIVVFLGILCILPDDSYGDETLRVQSQETVKVRTRVSLLVLGDIGRSPRMQYHALSIMQKGLHVDLIGYVESDLHPGIANSKYISVYPLQQAPAFLNTKNPYLFNIFGPLKVLWQTWVLYHTLGHTVKAAKFILVQNPPSIPTLAVAAAISWLRNSKLIIDWHNFGDTLLALKLGSLHPLVRFTAWNERFFGRAAVANFCVTEAMRKVLKNDFKLTAPIIVVHDRPADHFQVLTKEQRQLVLGALSITKGFIEEIKKDKVKVVVSATSWTADEDFQMFLDALVGYSALATSKKPNLPELLVVITGKGPMQKAFLRQVTELKGKDQLERVNIKTAWMSTTDYAGLLAAADLGVSMHMSSSGVDFPMKVIDMFGAGLPVLGWNKYEAWAELVEEGVNGKGFGSGEELKQALVELLGKDGREIERLRQGARKESVRGWDDEWDEGAGKVLDFK